MAQKNNTVLLRQQLFIDHNVQGSLLKRAALYGAACLIYFVVIVVFAESMAVPNEPLGDILFRFFDEAIYWAPGLILLAPLVAYDLLKVSNRFAGPVFRLRREMQRLIAGESIHPLSFRDNDYWTDMAEIFNQIRSELQELRQFKLDATAESAERRSPGSKKLFVADDQDAVDDFLVGVTSERA